MAASLYGTNELTRILLEHLSHEGVPEDLMQNLQHQLETTQPSQKRCKSLSGGAACTDLSKMFNYSTSGSLKVVVFSFLGGMEQYDVSAWTTVGKLKDLIEARTGIPASEQQLMYGSDTLSNNGKCMAQCQVHPFNANLILMPARPHLSGNHDAEHMQLWDMSAERLDLVPIDSAEEFYIS